MKIIYILAAALCVGQAAMAQDDNHIACLNNNDMSTLFQNGEASRLPNYSESAGARVQRQYPNTALISHAKYINWEGMTLGVCQYSNHIGIVANFIVGGGITADVSDEACDDGSCVRDAYWRSEWTESTPETDRPGKEQLYACMQNVEGAAIPSINCRFNKPAQ